MIVMMYSFLIFILAGVCEIGGGYLIWLWLREGQPSWLGVIGGLILILYGVIATLQTFPTFGRVYACLLYTSPSPRDQRGSRMPSSA